MMRFWLLLFLLIPVAAHAEQQVKIKSQVKVTGKSDLVLYDLVGHAVNDKKLAATLKKVRLGNAPKIGEKREFTGRALSMAIRNSVERKSHYQFKIPQNVVVENTGLELTKKLLSQELTYNWKKLCAECQFDIVALNTPLLPTGKYIKSFNINFTKNLPKGSFSIPTSLQFTDGSKSNIWISGQVKVLRKVTVTKRNLQRGDRLHHSDIKTAYRDVTFSYDSSPTVDQILGKKLTLGLQKDQVVWSQFVARERVLSRGEIVKVTLGNKGFSISMMAQAEHDAYVGDTVRLKNMKTKKIFSGIVNEQGKVVLR